MFLRLLRGFNKREKSIKPILVLVKARITLYFNNMFFFIRVLIKGK
jgi:hypothetical protein